MKLRVTMEIIGPKKAKKLLEKIPPWPMARSPKPRVVELFAKEMASGRWLPGGRCESLKVDDELGLVDGRMRLLAVIESGCEIEFTVIRGKFEAYHIERPGVRNDTGASPVS